AFKVSGREVDNVSGQTTTEAPEVQAWLGRMVDAGAQCVVIETTSHALVQERVRACEFDVAAFTNVGRDHLDYHATWEDYLEAKARLIDLTANAADKGVEKTAVLNRDDPSYERLARRPISRRWTYSLKTGADFYPLDLSITGSGSRFRMKTPLEETEVTLNVPAKFNIYNALCAAAVCVAMGVPVEEIGRGLDHKVDIATPAAVGRAIAIARPAETVLLAGKGHERWMRTARGSEPWDERAEAEAAIRERG